MINEAYAVEYGNDGIAFKKTNRLLHPTDSGLLEAYREDRVIKAVDTDGFTVGVIVWEIITKDDTNEVGSQSIYFGPFAVHPLHQGKGVGKLLLEEVYSIARIRGISFVDISVVNHRSDLFPVYTKLGFVTTGLMDFVDTERLSRPCHFVLMRKQI